MKIELDLEWESAQPSFCGLVEKFGKQQLILGSDNLWYIDKDCPYNIIGCTELPDGKKCRERIEPLEKDDLCEICNSKEGNKALRYFSHNEHGKNYFYTDGRTPYTAYKGVGAVEHYKKYRKCKKEDQK